MDDCCVYFIERGEVEIYFERRVVSSGSQKKKSSELKKKIRVLRKGESFGMQSFFTGEERKLTARSLEFCSILVLKKDDFLQKI